MAISDEPELKSWHIHAVGDVNPCRHLAKALLRDNIGDRSAALKNTLSGADLVIGNLEGPITSCAQKRRGQIWNLKMSPEFKELLSPFHGFSLANNHIFDFGITGVIDTFENLDALGIKYCGAGRNAEEAGKPAVFYLDGFRVSMIGFTDKNWHPSTFSRSGTNIWRGRESAEAIGKLHQDSDFVIVQIHHGYEFVNYPGPEEMDIAKQVIDAGGDLVLGHHSHYMMGVVRWGKGAIAYGLGDFLLDKMHIPQAYREHARICCIYNFEISRHRVMDWKIIPCKADRYGWPSPADDSLATSVQKEFQKLSRILEDEKKTQRLFRNQATKNMLPYALDLVKYLFIHDGLRAVITRLLRIRLVDIHVLGHYCKKLLKLN